MLLGSECHTDAAIRWEELDPKEDGSGFAAWDQIEDGENWETSGSSKKPFFSTSQELSRGEQWGFLGFLQE